MRCTCHSSPYLAWREQTRKMCEHSAPYPELWGGVMLGGEQEEGRFPGSGESLNSFLLHNPWDLTYGQGGGTGARKCKVCVCGHVRRACRC